LKDGVIDLLADDVPDLTRKLAGRKLKTPKHGVTELPQPSVTTLVSPMTVREKIVSFFADPQLAYLILSLGALCIWIELSHPGLIFPGILGAMCVIVSLVSFQLLPIDYGALAMILVGLGLILAELYLPTYGIVGIGGLASFIIGSLFLMDTAAPEFRLSLGIILPTAAVLAAFAFALGFLVLKSRKRRHLSGMEAMIGEYGEVREALDPKGKVFVRGELWNAISIGEVPLPVGSIVTVEETRNMVLLVIAAQK
jgi:membrane-bound serine protease (ClpP class)